MHGTLYTLEINGSLQHALAYIMKSLDDETLCWAAVCARPIYCRRGRVSWLCVISTVDTRSGNLLGLH